MPKVKAMTRIMRGCPWAAAVALMSLTASLPAGADGSAEAGKVLSFPCVDCHGADGSGVVPLVPRLNGQKESYLAAQIARMAGRGVTHGKRRNPFMTSVSGTLTAREVADLAAFYASLPGAAIPPAPASRPAEAARCVVCHGDDGLSAADDIPNLAAQSGAYLAEQIRKFRSAAVSDPSTRATAVRFQGVMEVQAMLLTDAEIERIADYFASQSASRTGS